MDPVRPPHGGCLSVFTAEERPELWEQAEASFPVVWPEYNLHGDFAGQYFAALFPEHANVQVLIYDGDAERVVARGKAIPCRWDGTLEDLPAGIDAVGRRALEEPAAPSALSALAAEVAPDQRGRRLSGVILGAMADVAAMSGLSPLLAPVRPSWKDRYPLIPNEQYARGRRDDGLPFDPWMRVHARVGGSIVRAERRSMRITGSVEDWQEWTGLSFPDDGTYVFPGGLAPLTVSKRMGRYWEPNVWMVHEVG